MKLNIASINSGSNANCYYIGTAQTGVLIDVGLNCRELERRMARMGLLCTTVKAVFVSHEHSDHIRGVYAFAKKYNVPVYITPGTYNSSAFSLKKLTTLPLVHETPVVVNELTVVPFGKVHDAADPVSFVVKYNEDTVGVITDVGIACDNVKRYVALCNALFLEANYDEQMLENGKYPMYLKRRIRGGKGHISNVQALDLVLNYASEKLQYLILSHLSKENNTPDLVTQLFKPYMKKTKLIVASRDMETVVHLFNTVQQKIEFSLA